MSETTDWLPFTTAANDNTNGSVNWNNPNGALADGNETGLATTYAAWVNAGTPYLLKLLGPQNVPAYCRSGNVEGIEVYFRISALNGSPTDRTCKLVKAGSIVGNDLALGGSIYSNGYCGGDGYDYANSICSHAYGGPTSLFGLEDTEGTIQGSIVDRADFGIVYNFNYVAGSQDLWYGAIRLTYRPSFFYIF